MHIFFDSPQQEDITTGAMACYPQYMTPVCSCCCQLLFAYSSSTCCCCCRRLLYTCCSCNQLLCTYCRCSQLLCTYCFVLKWMGGWQLATGLLLLYDGNINICTVLLGLNAASGDPFVTCRGLLLCLAC